jgi:hypothetical protein
MAEVTRAYGDTTTTNFPKMGEEPMTTSLVNVSGDRSPYTTMRPKGNASGGPLAGGTAARGVGPDATGEHSGPCFTPMTTISYPNAPEASQTGRGLRVMPSRVGNQDFWDSRYSSGQII